MTDLRKAAEMALASLEDLKEQVTQQGATPEHWDSYYGKQYYALEALRQALAQPEQESFIVDLECWERGCMAYDWRNGDGVNVTKSEWKTCRHCGFDYKPPKADKWFPLEQEKNS